MLAVRWRDMLTDGITADKENAMYKRTERREDHENDTDKPKR